MALLADPESNIKFLKEMLQLSKDSDSEIVKLGLLSLLAVFRDIIPGQVSSYFLSSFCFFIDICSFGPTI